MSTKVLLVGVGGATCSGKTTLAKHLKQILPDSVIIHQDDFAPPQELVPIHPIHNVQDWDAAPGAISWSKLVDFLRRVKDTGEIPPDHRSHDHLNEQKVVEIDDEVRDYWRSTFEDIKKEQDIKGGQKIIWGLVDGFLLYWNKQVIDQLDVCIFLRVPHDVLKKRRHERHGYHTAGMNTRVLILFVTLTSFLFHLLAIQIDVLFIDDTHTALSPAFWLPGVQSDPEGSLWRDPPGYWEQIVYPAYLDAHREVFEKGDVEGGEPSSKVKDLVVLESLKMEMNEVVKRCCEVLKAKCE